MLIPYKMPIFYKMPNPYINADTLHFALALQSTNINIPICVILSKLNHQDLGWVPLREPVFNEAL